MPQGEFNSILKEKIGNIILYLTKGEPTPFVKILKLLYLTDELAVKEEGAPITWLQYNAWQRGPVPVDVHNEFEAMLDERLKDKEHSLSLDTYITASKSGTTLIATPNKDFDNGKLSEYEIEVLDKIISEYGDWSVTRLVDKTHDENSLWTEVVKANNLEEYFKLNGSKSNFPVDFTKLIDTNYKESVYTSTLDSLRFNKYF